MVYRIFPVILMAVVLTVTAQTSDYPVIVHLQPGANIEQVRQFLGGTLVSSMPDDNIHLLALSAPSSLSAIPELGVNYIELDKAITLPAFSIYGIVTVPGENIPSWYRLQPAMQLVRATSAEAYSTGSGTIIADINSLVDHSHPALASHLIAGYDFVVEQGGGNGSLDQAATFLNQSSASFLDQSSASFLDQSSASFLDQSSASFLDGLNPAYSHGTLCAGVIAAVAPGSMIMPLRAFDENGTSSVFTLAKAIRYAVRQGAEVINMSFGTLAPSRTLEEAVNFAAVEGVTLVASAGNNNTSQPQYPAAYPNVMAVAATDLADIKAWFSNYGSHIFVTAPGVHVVSAYPGNLYGVVSGTSFSAPFVAGTAGLIRSITDTAPGNRIGPAARNIDLRNPWYAGKLGHGRLDVYSAVN